MKKKKSVYGALGTSMGRKLRKSRAPLEIYSTVRRLRQEKSMSGAELCRRAGDLDPRTLTAIEKGRIKNPSIQTLESLARGLNVQVSDLFKQAELKSGGQFLAGTQKGYFQWDFPSVGIKVVSFTPFVRDFFCGKIILSSRRKWDESVMRHPYPVFVSVLIGRIEAVIEDRRLNLKEGENLFLNGGLAHSFQNMLERETVLLVMTAPSFAASREPGGMPIPSRKY